MQRWFFDNDEETFELSPSCSSISKTEDDDFSHIFIQRTFKVVVNFDLCHNERVALTGGCDPLGNWKPKKAVIMDHEEGSSTWHITIGLPRGRTIKYRYFIFGADFSTEEIIIRKWETHLEARTIEKFGEEIMVFNDTFGYLNGIEKIDRGWLTFETIIQLKFFNAPFKWNQRMKNRLLYVKVTPMNLRIHGDNNQHALAMSPLEDSLSNDTRENGTELPSFGFSEVAKLKYNESVIQTQTQFGISCGEEDLVIFHMSVADPESTAYLVDLYAYRSKAASDEPPNHLGYHYILPNLLKRSEGNLEVPITCASKHRPLGMMQIGYLIVQPFQSHDFDMEVSYERYWNPKWTGLDVGHRGSGTSFKAKDSVIRENTITSLKNAAAHGADMVEFDVQLSKDLVPVIYHDFMVYVSLKSKVNQQDNDYLEIPMRELNLDQLKTLKVYHVAEGRSKQARSFYNDDLQEHQPFPKLADALDLIDPHVGFNIEIKWSQKLADGTMEEGFEHVVDRNLYVDCILEVVLRKAAGRRIVFSCFDPDICTMLRFKQNLYPVMFLTLGVTTKYKKFLDPRGNTIEAAVCHSLAMELLGIVAHTEDVLRDPSQINLAKDRGLIVFCWGDDNNSKDTIQLLKNMGLHAIIYDKMDILTTKENKKSVFLVQAKQNQNDLFELQCLERQKEWPEKENVTYKDREHHNRDIQMKRSSTWHITIGLPRGRTIKYRYFIFGADFSTEEIIIRKWETHLEARTIEKFGEEIMVFNDTFGYLNGIEKIDRGWLTFETIIQLKFFNAPFKWNQRMKNRLLYVKVTPMNLRIHGDNNQHALAMSPLEDSLSNDTRENGTELPSFGFSEVAKLKYNESVIQTQTQFGISCGEEDLVIFHMSVADPESTAYLVDLYAYRSKAASDEPPNHLGYHYILPNLLKRSEGNLEVPITCASKHRPLGMMQIGYLIVQPFQSHDFDMEVSYERYWNPKWTGLDVGHRGSGTSFKAKDSVIRENTITSLKNAAAHGADMVEFDVQLSKDLVPVIYHDFMVYVSLKSKVNQQDNDYLEIPMRELNLDQLKTLKVYHVAEGRSKQARSFYNDDLQEHQPFPKLADALDLIDPHVGFNIEIKWSQKLADGTMEEGFEHVVDRNLYVDCILEVVLRKAAGRRIVFSCFDPDICTMLRFKQNLYPVMFLTLGVTTKYKKFLDPRGNTIEAAVCHSLAMELLGIVAHTEDVLRDPSQINLAKDRGLIVFCWGDDNNSKDTIQLLKNMGLHAIIYDKMDILTTKENKKSVFLVQAKQNQNDLFELQCLERQKEWPEKENVTYKDREHHNRDIQMKSTATSLSSLSNRD